MSEHIHFFQPLTTEGITITFCIFSNLLDQKKKYLTIVYRMIYYRDSSELSWKMTTGISRESFVRNKQTKINFLKTEAGLVNKL